MGRRSSSANRGVGASPRYRRLVPCIDTLFHANPEVKPVRADTSRVLGSSPPAVQKLSEEFPGLCVPSKYLVLVVPYRRPLP